MRVISILSFITLLGVAASTPVTTDAYNALRDDVVEATTAAVGTVEAVFADEAGVTESVTHRARQESEDDGDDDDDDGTTPVPVVVSSTRAPVPPRRLNESTILSEFNFVAQRVDGPPRQVAPVVPAQVEAGAAAAPPSPVVSPGDDEEEANRSIVVEAAGAKASSAAVVVPDAGAAAEDNDSDNEIVRDDVEAATVKPSRPMQLEEEDNATFTYGGLAPDAFRGQGRAACECGKLPFKIPVNEQTGINPSPWLAAVVRGGLFAGGRPHCAGSLINNRYVLTSASCLDGLYATSIQVWLTAHDTFEAHQATFGNVKVNVQDIIMHPNYDRRSKDNDLALLRLTSSVDISGTSYFVPACLPGSSYNFAGTIARVSGWSDGRVFRMCKGEMPVLDNKICNRDSRQAGKITSNMVCAGFLTPTRETLCVGDAGGPLVSPNGGRATLIGVVSWGYEAKNRDYSPTVYTRVSEFSEWILHNTRDADWCGV